MLRDDAMLNLCRHYAYSIIIRRISGFVYPARTRSEKRMWVLRVFRYQEPPELSDFGKFR